MPHPAFRLASPGQHRILEFVDDRARFILSRIATVAAFFHSRQNQWIPTARDPGATLDTAQKHSDAGRGPQ